jgi:hypothetical protein
LKFCSKTTLFCSKLTPEYDKTIFRTWKELLRDKTAGGYPKVLKFQNSEYELHQVGPKWEGCTRGTNSVVNRQRCVTDGSFFPQIMFLSINE